MATYPLHLPPLIKSFLENTIKEKKLLCCTTLLANRIIQTMLLLSLFPPHPVSSLSNCLQANLVPVNSLNQHATGPAG